MRSLLALLLLFSYLFCSSFAFYSTSPEEDSLLRYYVDSVRRPEPLYSEYEFIGPMPQFPVQTTPKPEVKLRKVEQQSTMNPKLFPFQKRYKNYHSEQNSPQNRLQNRPQKPPRIIKAAVITRYSVEDRTQEEVPQEYYSSEPISIEVESRHHRPMIIHFRSPKRPIRIRQSFDKPEAVLERTSAEDEPIRLYHEVTRPIIQEVREQILPRRKVIQELRPVEEEIRTIIASSSSTNAQNSSTSGNESFELDDMLPEPVFTGFDNASNNSSLPVGGDNSDNDSRSSNWNGKDNDDKHSAGFEGMHNGTNIGGENENNREQNNQQDDNHNHDTNDMTISPA